MAKTLITLHAITFDCRDAQKVADFWSEFLQVPIDGVHPGGIRTIAAQNGYPLLVFQPMDSLSTERPRVHPDFHTGDLAADTRRVLEMGGGMIEEVTLPGLRFNSLTDVEGNKFDLVGD